MSITKAREFLKLESASGIILIFVAVVAILIANSPLANYYEGLLTTNAEIHIGELGLEKPLLLWINEGLMAIFFLLIGLEIKRELLEGRLADRSKLALPVIGAIGGMVVPVSIYVWLNRGDSLALNGWAIPAATDIAFALGILALLGERVPISLKLFLTVLAIIDDLGAIVVIAIFYTNDLSLLSLVLAATTFIIMLALNYFKITRAAIYCVFGILLWIFMLKSGVHATLAGVAVAFTIPLRVKNEDGHSLLRHLEHSIHPWVGFGILPLFAFTNSGVSFKNVSLAALGEPLSLGIIFGLFLGKQLGIFGFTWIGVRFGKLKLPEDMNWLNLYGMAVLCGVGFTMSLFIGSLAFERGGPDYTAVKLGILTGSFISGIFGYLLLHYSLYQSDRGPRRKEFRS